MRAKTSVTIFWITKKIGFEILKKFLTLLTVAVTKLIQAVKVLAVALLNFAQACLSLPHSATNQMYHNSQDAFRVLYL